jgi:hypothetical protein
LNFNDFKPDFVDLEFKLSVPTQARRHPKAETFIYRDYLARTKEEKTRLKPFMEIDLTYD